jgi:predicted SAM-dependent methyltransferase
MAEMAELLKLHVGCGKRLIPGFVHIDQVAFAHVDHVQDIRRLANFADNSASLIYACQVIEYFDYEEVIGVLTDWRRVLAPGGVLRLSVPNFAVICNPMSQASRSINFLARFTGGFPTARMALYITARPTTSNR